MQSVAQIQVLGLSPSGNIQLFFYFFKKILNNKIEKAGEKKNLEQAVPLLSTSRWFQFSTVTTNQCVGLLMQHYLFISVPLRDRAD